MEASYTLFDTFADVKHGNKHAHIRNDGSVSVQFSWGYVVVKADGSVSRMAYRTLTTQNLPPMTAAAIAKAEGK